MNVEDIEIRRGRSAEADALTGVAHAAKRRWGYPEELIDLWTPDLTVPADFVDTHPVYCAVSGTQILGFYALSRDRDIFELEHMWIDPPYMRAGVGARLFAHAVETVRRAGGSRLRIAADPNAEGFYRRMGAGRIGEVPSTPAGRMLPLFVVEIDSLGASHSP
jgi:GNAT superfamily N-acetyltransferase